MEEKMDITPAVPWAPAIFDIDLQAGISDAFKACFLDAYAQHHLVIIRTGVIDFDRQAELASMIAPVLGPPDSRTYISNVRSDGYLGNTELAFHNDIFFTPEPYYGLSLHAIDVASKSSSTRFANAARGYTLLPDTLKQKLSGLKAVHISGAMNFAGRNHLKNLPEGWPQYTRPLIWEHPTKGLKLLSVNYEQTDKILGMGDEESEALLQELFGILYRPDNIFEHSWSNGDLIYWDNLALQHARGEVDSAQNRTLQRLAFGGLPFKEQCPEPPPTVFRGNG